MNIGEVIFSSGSFYVVDNKNDTFEIFQKISEFPVLMGRITFEGEPDYARRRAINKCGILAAAEEAEKRDYKIHPAIDKLLKQS